MSSPVESPVRIVPWPRRRLVIVFWAGVWPLLAHARSCKPAARMRHSDIQRPDQPVRGWARDKATVRVFIAAARAQLRLDVNFGDLPPYTAGRMAARVRRQ